MWAKSVQNQAMKLWSSRRRKRRGREEEREKEEEEEREPGRRSLPTTAYRGQAHRLVLSAYRTPIGVHSAPTVPVGHQRGPLEKLFVSRTPIGTNRFTVGRQVAIGVP